MKFFSTATAALLLGSVSVLSIGAIPSEAMAQKNRGKEEDKANAEPKISKKFGKAYIAATPALETGDPAAINAAIASLKEKAKGQNDQYWLSRYQYSAGRKLNDDAIQLEALKSLSDSALTPPRLKNAFRSELALLAYNKLKDYQLAADVFQQIHASSGEPTIAFNVALAYIKLGNHSQSIMWADKAIDMQTAKGGEIPASWRSTKRDAWYNAMSPVRNDKYADSFMNLSYLRLFKATGNMRFSGLYNDYAQFAVRMPNEVVAVFDQGFADGTIEKSEITFSEIYNDAKTNAAEITASLTKDEQDAAANSKGFLAMIAGDNLLSVNEYGRAIKMYELALQKGNIAGRDGIDQSEKVQIELARARLGNGDSAGAKAELAKLTSPNGKELAGFWSLYIDTES